jgi:hypothetical protein
MIDILISYFEWMIVTYMMNIVYIYIFSFYVGIHYLDYC